MLKITIISITLKVSQWFRVYFDESLKAQRTYFERKSLVATGVETTGTV